MVARTVAIDAELCNAALPQVVILGAGLDGRAWRMRELVRAVVFEVDHPDSQQQKLQRVAPLTLEAREVRFVPLDFRHDDLAQATVRLPDLLKRMPNRDVRHKLTVETWNDQPVTGTLGKELLEQAGFVRDYQAMTWFAR